MLNGRKFNLTDIRQIMEICQTIADRNWPGHVGGKLVIRMADGCKHVLPVAAWKSPAQTSPEADHAR